MGTRVRILHGRLVAGALVLAAALAALFAGASAGVAQTPGGAPRLALVIGEAAYRTGPLSTPANDAGLIADTLQLAGFDVTGAADLDQDGLRKALREFVDKASAAGPDATVFIYLAGRGVQYEGENYLAPVEAVIPRASNVPLEAVRLNNYLQPLAQAPLKARIVVLDLARANAFAQAGAPLAGGLALVEPGDGALTAFNAAPGSVAPEETGPYGVYAQSLAEMLREGGLPADDAFARARLRASEQTKGASVPWDQSKLAPAPVLFARAPGAPPPVVALETQANLRARPIRDYPVDQAYAAALEQDTLASYMDFLNAYPNSPFAARVRAMLAVRREAATWRRAWLANTPNACWTYLQRYPHGPHGEDARLRLGALNAAYPPPPHFDAYEFDAPPPVEQEAYYFHRPFIVFDDSDFGAPPPVGWLLPPRPILVDRAPPPPPRAGLLPLVAAAPLLYALPAVRQGLLHAPSVVQAQQPGANGYYSNRKRAQAQPEANPTLPAAPVAAAPVAAAPVAAQPLAAQPLATQPLAAPPLAAGPAPHSGAPGVPPPLPPRTAPAPRINPSHPEPPPRPRCGLHGEPRC